MPSRITPERVFRWLLVSSAVVIAGLLLCIWAYFVRTAGASLVLASAIFLLLKARRREAVVLLGGFVMVRLWRIPATGDSFDWGGLSFEVVDMDGLRVDKVLVVSAPTPQHEENDSG